MNLRTLNVGTDLRGPTLNIGTPSSIDEGLTICMTCQYNKSPL